MFYETNHSGFSNEFIISKSQNLNFPTHIHRNFEIAIGVMGTTHITIDNKNYKLNSLSCAVVFPHISHAYIQNNDNVALLCIFSPNIIPCFFKYADNRLPENPVFQLDEKFIKAFIDIDTNKNTVEYSRYLKEPFGQKSLLYGILSKLLQETALVSNAHKDNGDLLERMLFLIDDNIIENGKLSVLAKKLGYDYTYLSKYFIKQTGIPFSKYLNMCRIDLACQMLGKNKMIDIAMNTGYSSVRSFNGNFKTITGMTPTEYIKSHNS